MDSDNDDDDDNENEVEEGDDDDDDPFTAAENMVLRVVKATMHEVIFGDQTSLEGAIRLAIHHNTNDELKNGDGAKFVASGSLDPMFPDITIDGIGELLLPANAFVAQVSMTTSLSVSLNNTDCIKSIFGTA
jgi:hypothetical protein